MGEKFETAAIISLDVAELVYRNGVALIVTDGKYVQLEDERR